MWALCYRRTKVRLLSAALLFPCQTRMPALYLVTGKHLKLYWQNKPAFKGRRRKHPQARCAEPDGAATVGKHEAADDSCAWALVRLERTNAGLTLRTKKGKAVGQTETQLWETSAGSSGREELREHQAPGDGVRPVSDPACLTSETSPAGEGGTPGVPPVTCSLLLSQEAARQPAF